MWFQIPPFISASMYTVPGKNENFRGPWHRSSVKSCGIPWPVTQIPRRERVKLGKKTVLRTSVFLSTNLIYITWLITGKPQFLFLYNLPKSGASPVRITFPQITQKILTEDKIHWLELITEILSFLQIFSVRK